MMDLFAREHGSGSVPVVLLHGFGGTHKAWTQVQEMLAVDMATLAYDLPGHGASLGFPGAGPAKVAAQAILADLAERRLERVHLVGHSMGGAIAALMAIVNPRQVASLTLLAPGGFGPEINHRLLTHYAAAIDERELSLHLEAMTGWFSPVSPETIAVAAKSRDLPGQRDVLVEMAKGLVRDGRQGQIPRDLLEALTMPVSVVWGELDNVLPARHAKGLPGHFAVHTFPSLGHMLPDEAPAEVTAIIRQSAGR